MSLILDALNRADRERKNTETTPDINTVHELEYHPRSKPKAKMLVALILVILVMAVLWFASQWLRGRSVSDAPVQPASTSIPTSTQAPATDTAMKKPSAANSDSVANKKNRTASVSKAPESDSAINSLYSDSDAGPSPKAANQVSDLYKEPEESAVVQSVPIATQKITPVSLVEDSQPAESVNTTATTTTAAENTPAIGSTKNYAALKNVPDLSELPVSFQQEIPSLLYSQHNFSADGVSNVVINGRPRLARTVIAEGLSLDEIYVDGILLRFRERKFKLRALNSWVNM